MAPKWLLFYNQIMWDSVLKLIPLGAEGQHLYSKLVTKLVTLFLRVSLAKVRGKLTLATCVIHNHIISVMSQRSWP